MILTALLTAAFPEASDFLWSVMEQRPHISPAKQPNANTSGCEWKPQNGTTNQKVSGSNPDGRAILKYRLQRGLQSQTVEKPLCLTQIVEQWGLFMLKYNWVIIHVRKAKEFTQQPSDS